MSEAVQSDPKALVPKGIPVHEDERGEYVNIRSSVAGRRLTFQPDQEERDYLTGRYVVRARGAMIKFANGMGKCYLEWLPSLLKNKEWDRTLYFADDPRASRAAGPAVRMGMASSAGAPGLQTVPPPAHSASAPDGWDEQEVSDLISEIKLGKHDDQLTSISMHELTHRNRSQVVTSLSKRLRDLETEQEE